jgi:hypothetical protein
MRARSSGGRVRRGVALGLLARRTDVEESEVRRVGLGLCVVKEEGLRYNGEEDAEDTECADRKPEYLMTHRSE